MKKLMGSQFTAWKLMIFESMVSDHAHKCSIEDAIDMINEGQLTIHNDNIATLIIDLNICFLYRQVDGKIVYEKEIPFALINEGK